MSKESHWEIKDLLRISRNVKHDAMEWENANPLDGVLLKRNVISKIKR